MIYISNFYTSTPWLHKREDILRRDNFECQMCKKRGKFHVAETVHHIKHLKEYPSLALDDDNLISLCNACHNIVHPEKGLKNQSSKRFINKERW